MNAKPFSNPSALFVLFLCIGIATLTGCFSVQEIGRMDTYEPRNLDSTVTYVLLKNYMGGRVEDFKKTRAKTIDQAVIDVVRNTPGGEFLKNVKIFIVNGKYVAVEADVWGKTLNHNFRGFQVGERVQWDMTRKNPPTGSIHELLNEKECIVRSDEGGKLILVNYDEMQKLEPKIR